MSEEIHMWGLTATGPDETFDDATVDLVRASWPRMMEITVNAARSILTIKWNGPLPPSPDYAEMVRRLFFEGLRFYAPKVRTAVLTDYGSAAS